MTLLSHHEGLNARLNGVAAPLAQTSGRPATGTNFERKKNDGLRLLSDAVTLEHWPVKERPPGEVSSDLERPQRR